MAQRTAAALITRARQHANDNDSSLNYGVSDTLALAYCNDVLMRWSFNVRSKPVYLAATTTGLTFSAGDVSKVTGDNTASTMRISGFESFHSAASSSLSFPLPPALDVVTVDEIREMLRYDGDNALAQAATDWTHVAYEKTQDATAAGAEKWRVWAYPVINRTRYLTVRAAVYTQVSASSETPDIEEADWDVLARFLAFEIAKSNRMPGDFMDNILALVPRDVVDQMHGGAVYGAQLQDRVVWRDW